MKLNSPYTKGAVALLGLGMASAGLATEGQFVLRNEIEITKPAFLRTVTRADGTPSLFVSSFKVFGSGEVFQIPNADRLLNSEELIEVQSTLQDVTWPNEVRELQFPNSFGNDFVSVADGFLVPGRSTGGVHLVNRETGDSAKISTDKRGWFYHRAITRDWDNDGLNDVISARAKTSLFGGESQAELVWFKNPGNLDQAWQEEVIVQGPGVMFEIADLNGDNEVEILATQFFSQRFVVYSKVDGAYVPVYTDDTLGKAFDLELADINNDGRTDVLVTNHEDDERAAVFTYEIPSDLTGEWTRHTLYEGFETRQPGPNQGSPGNAVAIHPDQNDTSGKPWILVSGDGTQRAHILKPTSEDAGNWDYEKTDILDAGATVGLSSAADLNGDGLLEVMVPSYDKNVIYVFEFERSAP